MDKFDKEQRARGLGEAKHGHLLRPDFHSDEKTFRTGEQEIEQEYNDPRTDR